MASRFVPALLAGLLSVSFSISAQTPSEPGAALSETTPVESGPPPAESHPANDGTACCVLADGTLVQIEIAETLNSKTAQRGQPFRLRLSEPVLHDGITLLPAGTEGVGEVIHADRARVGGKAGELLLAARSLQGPDGSTIPLRGLKLGVVGKDHSSGAIATAIAFGVIGMAVHGGEVEVTTGTPAQAKLTGPITLPPLPAVPAADAPIMEPTSPAKSDDAGGHPRVDTGQDMPEQHTIQDRPI